MPLDGYQHRQVAGSVRLENHELCLATSEGPRRPLDGGIRAVEARASITAVGRKKDRNVEHDPRVTIAVQQYGDAYRWVSIEGVVERRELGPGAEDHIAELALAYDGAEWTPVEGQIRVRWHVRPTHIIRYGE